MIIFWASALDYWQFWRNNVRPHRTCSLPMVDSALAKIRVLYFLHAQTVSPFMLCISRLNVLAPRVSPVRKSAMPNRRPPNTPPTYEYENVKKIFIKDNLHKLFKQKTKKRTLVSPLFIFLCFIIQRIH